MSTPGDGLRDSFQRLLIAELVELRVTGCEPPLDQDVVVAAAERVYIGAALGLARRDGRRGLAWLLARYLRTIQPASARK